MCYSSVARRHRYVLGGRRAFSTLINTNGSWSPKFLISNALLPPSAATPHFTPLLPFISFPALQDTNSSMCTQPHCFIRLVSWLRDSNLTGRIIKTKSVAVTRWQVHRCVHCQAVGSRRELWTCLGPCTCHRHQGLYNYVTVCLHGKAYRVVITWWKCLPSSICRGVRYLRLTPLLHTYVFPLD